ncbi:NAD+ kinase [Pustulibacterium marinum]|uniref:NAD kinase n=1 Tax=Pustulibacterium marinum TaxID=1224947 RepID=A0A1I7GR41_9FLAO|nr:NAD kinase [Pustulibacterium marinum]SFU50907.1 NAD+ kinase [Pustulibacterium marinum]
MKIGIYGQYYHDNSASHIKNLLETLESRNVDFTIKDDYLKLLSQEISIEKNYKTFSSFEELDTSFELFITIGGDGTILRAITYIRDLGIPILGINTGRLGFLATVQKYEINDTIDQILNKEFKVEERTLIELTTNANSDFKIDELNFALNEITISRKNTTSMITVSTFLNDEYLTSYWADGLIISTPTGSTGYSLSCGGPVIMPNASNLVLTPIAPHNLNARPLVIPDNTEIKLKISGREESFLASLDSRITTINSDTIITIKKCSFKINLVELYSESFLKTIRKKLLWGEDKRN